MDMTLPVRLFIAHILGDFLLQPDRWVADRNSRHFASKYLYLHGLVHFLLVLAFSANAGGWWMGLLIGVGHVVLDGLKAVLKRQDLWSFIVDQVLHFIIIVLCWCIANSALPVYLIQMLLADFRLWWLLSGYLLNILFFPRLIALATQTWRTDIPSDRELLYKAGRWIGILERVLVFTLILAKQYAAVGFLLAAKSIFRFGDLRDNKDKGHTEYVLIGTLLSVGLALLTGIVWRFVIDLYNAHSNL